MVSYTTVSPLPVPLRAIGGLFSAALSVGFPRLDVIQHLALWSPDFPQRPKAPQPSNGLATRKDTSVVTNAQPPASAAFRLPASHPVSPEMVTAMRASHTT